MDNTNFYKERLNNIGIKYQTVRHQPVLTMKNSHLLKGITVVKNMVIKNKALDQYIMIMLMADKKIARTLNTSRNSLRFATEAELAEDLNVLSGFVSPLVVMQNQYPIIFLADPKLASCSRLGFHIGRNDETVIISYSDLKEYSQYINIVLKEIMV